ncbi:MAG: N-acetylglucosamine-6-phosphate deacetylase [Clostridia bacterium]|nr:N-acetylglucosamine-6-phosphate deacetylase [Clostridia bacterium]
MVKILKNIRPYGGELTDVTVKDGRILSLAKTDAEGEDCGSAYLFPGLIEIHSHGCMGDDTMDGTDAVRRMLVYQFEHGITTYYPTTMTAPIERIAEIVNQPLCSVEGGANHLGYHMEGPFFCERYKGGQNGDFLSDPDLDGFSKLQNVSLISVAPELRGAMEFIRDCKSTVCIGHTAANFAIADAAFKAGALCITHTCNAMPPFHHRDSSVIGAGIMNDAYAQVIGDGMHISEPMVIALYRIFGRRRMILISDSMSATGLCDGEYELGGQRAIVKGGLARLENGTICGSTTNLFDCVRRVISFGIPPLDAFAMASETPAALLGLNKGRLEVGYDADFILTDENYSLLRTMILK